MKTIEINVPEGKRAEWVNGVLTLVDEKNKDVTRRIKTFEDACKELSSLHPFVEEYETITSRCGGLSDDILAYLKLRIITAALNEGWEPQFTEDEYRHYPWFNLYIQKDIDEMGEEKKRRMVCLSSDYALDYGGASYSDYDSSGTVTHISSLLTFKTKKLAEYAGKQFIEIWADYVFKPNEL